MGWGEPHKPRVDIRQLKLAMALAKTVDTYLNSSTTLNREVMEHHLQMLKDYQP